MTHSSLFSQSRRTLQLATLFLLAAAPLAFGGEPVTPDHEDQLIGQMVVSAARERVLVVVRESAYRCATTMTRPVANLLPIKV